MNLNFLKKWPTGFGRSFHNILRVILGQSIMNIIRITIYAQPELFDLFLRFDQSDSLSLVLCQTISNLSSNLLQSGE